MRIPSSLETPNPTNQWETMHSCYSPYWKWRWFSQLQRESWIHPAL